MNIYCFRKSQHIVGEELCRVCLHRRKCRAFQLWLQPELPFVFRHYGRQGSVFDLQNEIKNYLDSLFPVEYRLLKKRAFKLLPDAKDENSVVVRLKMYELLHVKDCKH